MTESPAKGVNRPIPVPPRSRARPGARSDDGDTSVGEDKAAIESLLREKTAAKDEASEKAGECASLKSELDAAREQISALEKQLSEKSDGHASLEKQLADHGADHAALEKQLADKTAEHDALAKAASEKEASYQSLTADANSKQDAHAAIMAQLSERDEQLTDAARQLDSTSKAHEALVADLQEQLRAATESHESRSADYEGRLSDAAEREAALQARFDEAARSHAAAVEQLNKEIDGVSAARDDVTKRSALWIDELENLRTEHAQLTERVGQMDGDERISALESRISELEAECEAQRERADSAEDRVRQLRFTAEESRRAIMRLQEAEARAKAGKPDAHDDDTQPKHARRLSAVGRTLSGDDEEKPTGLRGLMLSGAATSPSIDGNSPTMPQGKEEPEVESPQPAVSRPLSLFSSSLLRPAFGLRKKNDEEPARSEADVKAEAAREAAREQEEKDAAEIEALRKQVQVLQDQLLENREALNAGELCIKSLREYIVRSQGGEDTSTPAPAPSAAPSVVSGKTRKVPPIPTAAQTSGTDTQAAVESQPESEQMEPQPTDQPESAPAEPRAEQPESEPAEQPPVDGAPAAEQSTAGEATTEHGADADPDTPATENDDFADAVA